MKTTIKKNLPDIIWQISHFRRQRLFKLLSLLDSNKFVSGILLGGSLCYKHDFVKSDIDLFCLINQLEIFENNLNKILSPLYNLDVLIFQGFFPWTENLYTIYFKKDIDFSIDLCLINSSNAENFFWEPDGYILIDKMQIIEKYRTKQMSRTDFSKQPFLKSNPFSMAVITLKKIEKNLSRRHLWNALEQLNILRRYVMQIIRLNVIKHYSFLGRVDRDIEDIIPEEINLKLTQTTAIYDTNDIAIKTILLIEIIITLIDYLKESKEKELENWVMMQLMHEKEKLREYLK